MMRHRILALLISLLVIGAAGAPLAISAGALTNRPTATFASGTKVAGGSLDPCSLVTASGARAALGTAVRKPDRTPQGPEGEWCSYGSQSSRAAVVIGVQRGVSKEQFKAAVQAEAKSVGLPAKPVSGVGDEAYSILSLYARKGNVFLTVSLDAMGFVGLEKRIRATKEVALKAIARIP